LSSSQQSSGAGSISETATSVGTVPDLAAEDAREERALDVEVR
jgi:hypothetical protein